MAFMGTGLTSSAEGETAVKPGFQKQGMGLLVQISSTCLVNCLSGQKCQREKAETTGGKGRKWSRYRNKEHFVTKMNAKGDKKQGIVHEPWW